MTVSEFTGPGKIKRERPTTAFECYCHLCNWVNYEWTEPEARNILVWHLDTAHFNPPKPLQWTAALCHWQRQSLWQKWLGRNRIKMKTMQNRKKRAADTDLLIRLYRKERMTLQDIGERVGVTKQAVHIRLKRAGVQMRQKGKRMKPTTFDLLKREVDLDAIVRKYQVEKLPVTRIAEQTGLSYNFVRMVLKDKDIKIRPGTFYNRRRLPELYALKKSESVIVEYDWPDRPWSRLHGYAHKAGIRISVRKIGKNKFQIQRIG